MKVVKFKGGLGNQLFQYAFLRNLEIKYNCDNVKGDFFYYTNIKNDLVRLPRIEKLNVRINKVNNGELSKVCFFRHNGDPMSLMYKGAVYLEKILNKQYYFESDRRYREIETILNYKYFDGYWQSWRYVFEIENKLRREITPKYKLSQNTEKIMNKISKENAVFIGIRRGDYLTTSKAMKHFGNIEMEYYLKAIDYIKVRVENPVFYIFSNDIKWVKQNMKFDCNAIYRDDEEQTSDVEELFIMAACKHAIIVNSTYYWWGAWLINNTNKIVIAPNKWFADNKPINIVPELWVKM